MVLQPVVLGRVELVESVVEISRAVNLPLLGGWTATSNTDSLVVSSVASSMGQPARSETFLIRFQGDQLLFTPITLCNIILTVLYNKHSVSIHMHTRQTDA